MATRKRGSETPATADSPATPRKRRTPKAPPSGHWDGDTFVCAPTAYEQKRAKQVNKRDETPAEILRRAQVAAARTRWEEHLLRDIRAAHLPEPHTQFRWHPTRDYRADFAYADGRTMLLIEVDGGIWLSKGGHTTGAGYERDRVRDAEALCLGYRVLRVTPGMVERGEAVAYIERVLRMIWQGNGKKAA